MSQPENRLSKKIISALNQQKHCFAYKNHGSQFMMAGLPDVICCYRGRFIGLEVKMPDKRGNTSAAQDYVHKLIANAQGSVAVVTSVVEAMTIIKAIDDMISKGM